VRVETERAVFADPVATAKFEAFCEHRMAQECATYDLPFDAAQMTVERLPLVREQEGVAPVPVILRLVIDGNLAMNTQSEMALMRRAWNIPEPDREPLQ
jgi:hypothetical protein